MNNIKDYITYEPETGKFWWVKRKNSQKGPGEEAGSINKKGYIQIMFNKKRYYAHRLAWYYTYNEWPKQQIDHINGIKNDNRIKNLDDVSNRKNNQKKKRHLEGKLVGAQFHKRDKVWISQIRINNKTKQIGTFKTEIEAHEAYKKYVKEIENVS